MNITPEQAAIVASTGDIVINAVAGSGKTTTLIEYARARPVSPVPAGGQPSGAVQRAAPVIVYFGRGGTVLTDPIAAAR